MDESIFFYICIFIVSMVMGLIIGSDAENRGMNGRVWGICTFFF